MRRILVFLVGLAYTVESLTIPATVFIPRDRSHSLFQFLALFFCYKGCPLHVRSDESLPSNLFRRKNYFIWPPLQFWDIIFRHHFRTFFFFGSSFSQLAPFDYYSRFWTHQDNTNFFTTHVCNWIWEMWVFWLSAVGLTFWLTRNAFPETSKMPSTNCACQYTFILILVALRTVYVFLLLWTPSEIEPGFAVVRLFENSWDSSDFYL